ncbi:alpha/beta hydrolase [Gryllotalpicola koreensis]
MDVIMLPGFWLGGSSWRDVAPIVAKAGHSVHPITLPGLESVSTPRAGVTLQTQIDAAIAEIDAASGPVALVAHSGASSIAGGALDARPDRVVRVIEVDTFPVPERPVSEPEFPVEGDGVPLPDWSAFGEAEVKDLTPELRDEIRAGAVPEPAHVLTDPIELRDDRRHDVPLTMICTAFPAAEYRPLLDEGHPWMSELAKFRDVTWVDIDTGHWPQFTKPVELGEAIAAALAS